MSGLGVTGGQSVEIISAYTATNQSVMAVAAAPGWQVVGAFHIGVSADCQLEIIGQVSDPSLVMSVQIFDLETNAPVSGSNAQLSSAAGDVRATSGVISLVGSRSYQIQAQVVGGAGPSLFGVMKSATLI